MILFRADANSKIGSGHIMRCLSIADAALLHGEQSCFITADNSLGNIIKSRGYENIVLNTDYSNPEAEIGKLSEVIKHGNDVTDNLKAVFVDSYYVTNNYLSTLKSSLPKNTKLVYIDDLLKFAYPVDVLINYGLEIQQANYEKIYDKLPALMLLGLSYAPLRKEFQGLAFKQPAQSIKNVLISTGGSDAEHITLKILNGIIQRKEELKDQIFHFVVGDINLDKDKIIAVAKDVPNVVIHQNVHNMHEIMALCDVAVSAGGTTILELCASSLPIIAYSFAENQEGIKQFANKGLALYAGDARANNSFIDNIFRLLKKLSEDYELRKTLAEKAYSLVDGKGAERVVKEILRVRYRLNEYSMRPIEESDLPQILEWRNSDEIRNMMLTNHKITWNEHYNWFKRIEQNPVKRYFIFEYQNKPIGYIGYNEFDEENKSCSPGMYIGDKKNAPGDAGFAMSYIIGKYAFYKMGLLSLKSEIFAKNKNALAINKFFRTPIIGEYYIEKNGEKELVKKLEITKEQWMKNREERLRDFFNDI